MASIKDIQVDITELTKGIDKIKEHFSPKDYAAVTMMMENIAKKGENYAKENRPWIDRTGEARKRLIGYSNWPDSSHVEAIVAHQVEYGVFLELSHQRKYAILEDAINNAYDKEGKKALQSLMKKIVGG